MMGAQLIGRAAARLTGARQASSPSAPYCSYPVALGPPWRTACARPSSGAVNDAPTFGPATDVPWHRGSSAWYLESGGRPPIRGMVAPTMLGGAAVGALGVSRVRPRDGRARFPGRYLELGPRRLLGRPQSARPDPHLHAGVLPGHAGRGCRMSRTPSPTASICAPDS